MAGMMAATDGGTRIPQHAAPTVSVPPSQYRSGFHPEWNYLSGSNSTSDSQDRLAQLASAINGNIPQPRVNPGLESLKNVTVDPYVSGQAGDPRLRYIGALQAALSPAQPAAPSQASGAQQGVTLENGTSAPSPSYRPGFSPEWNYLPNAPKYLQPDSALDRTLNDGSGGNSGGGVGAGSGDSGSDSASTDTGNGGDGGGGGDDAAGGWVHNGRVNHPVPPKRHAKGGLASLGSAHHGTTASIVAEAKAALSGEHPKPQEALKRFRDIFGDGALYALSEGVTKGDRSHRAAKSPTMLEKELQYGR